MRPNTVLTHRSNSLKGGDSSAALRGPWEGKSGRKEQWHGRGKEGAALCAGVAYIPHRREQEVITPQLHLERVQSETQRGSQDFLGILKPLTDVPRPGPAVVQGSFGCRASGSLRMSPGLPHCIKQLVFCFAVNNGQQVKLPGCRRRRGLHENLPVKVVILEGEANK